MARSKRARATDWSHLCRLYVATRDEKFLALAIDACGDDRVLALLHHEADSTGTGFQLDEWHAVSNALSEEGAWPQSAVLVILAWHAAAYRLRAAAERTERSEAEQLLEELRGAQRRSDGSVLLDATATQQRVEEELAFAEDVCSAMLELSRKFGFIECQAFFLLTLGIQQLRTERWSEAELVLLEASQLYRQLEYDTPGRYAPDAMLAFEQCGRVLLQLRRFREAYELLRGAESMLDVLTQLSPAYEPVRLRVASMCARALIGLRRFGAAAEKLQPVWTEQRERALRQRDQAAFDMCETGVALATALLHRASSQRTYGRAREVARLTLASLQQLSRQSALHIYTAAHYDAHYNLAWANLQLGRFRSAKTELASAELYCFMQRNDAGTYPARQAAIHHRRAQALGGEGRTEKALRELQTARALLETASARTLDHHRLAYAATLDELAHVHGVLGDAELSIEHADLAVAEAELSCRDPHDAVPAPDGAPSALDPRQQRAHELGLGMQPADPTLNYLSKGAVARSYAMLAAHRAERHDPQGLFLLLAAQREGAVFATFADAAAGPAAESGVRVVSTLEHAGAALREIEQRTGRRLAILIAQNSGAHDAVIGVLHSEPPYLACVHEPGLRRTMGSLPDELQRVFLAGGTSAVEWRRRIGAAGARAWQRLPAHVRAVLEPAAGGDVLISGDPYWTAYPWEGLFSADWDFLGMQRALVRWTPITAAALRTLQPLPLGNGGGEAAVICPWNVRGQKRLPASRREAEAVAALLRARGFSIAAEHLLIGEAATAGAAFECLRADTAIVHYAGHGLIDGREELLALHADPLSPDTGYFGSAHIDLGKEHIEHDAALLASRPLLTLSACFAGRTREFGGLREDLVWKLLSEGAGAVIASPHPVFDETTAAVGPLLYQDDDAADMAARFTAVRARIEHDYRNEPTWPMWLFLTYHGNPFAYLAHASHSDGGARS